MKILIIFAFYLLANYHSPIYTKYVIYFDQSNILRPIPNNIESFWSDSNDFDTITIQGEKIIQNLQKKIDDFRIVKSNSIIHSTFSIENAIVRFKDNLPIDTIYTNNRFRYWNINGIFFEDKNHFFENKFAVFFDKS